MARILLVSIYDEFCRGPRQLLANLQAAGHEAWLLVFKLHRRRELATDEIASPEWQIEIQPGGGRAVLPYPFEPTDCERDLARGLMQALRPDCVGVAVYSPQVRQAAEFTALIREALPQTPVMWGGPHATCLPEQCLDYADWAMVGESDTSIVDLARFLDGSGEEAHVPSLVWRRPDGQIVRNPLAPLVKDLDSLPFPWHRYERVYYIDDDHLYDNRPPADCLYARNFRIMTSRGCPFACSYCMLSYQKEVMPETAGVRKRSIAHVIAELEEVKARRGEPFFVELEDDVFTIQLSRMEEFFEQYTPKIGFPFWCYTHPRYARPDMLDLLKRNRCTFLIMGIQTGSDRIAFEVFNRAADNSVVVEAAENIRTAGLRAFYDLISNNPFETDEDRLSTLNLIRTLPKPFELQLAALNFYPNLKITRMKAEQELPDADWHQYRFWNSMYQLASATDMSEEIMNTMLADPYLREHPEAVEWMAGQACEAVQKVGDKDTVIDGLYKDLNTLRRSLDETQGNMHRLHMRKGFRWFIKLSNLLGGGDK